MKQSLIVPVVLAGILATGCGPAGGGIVDLGAAPQPTGAAYRPLLIVASPTPAPPLGSDGTPNQSALHDVLESLNANTAETARGEYIILNDLGDALRGQIDGLLAGVGR